MASSISFLGGYTDRPTGFPFLKLLALCVGILLVFSPSIYHNIDEDEEILCCVDRDCWVESLPCLVGSYRSLPGIHPMFTRSGVTRDIPVKTDHRRRSMDRLVDDFVVISFCTYSHVLTSPPYRRWTNVPLPRWE